MVLGPALVYLRGVTLLQDTFLGNPLRTWSDYKRDRGMSPWRDVADWVGGYPFEVAHPEEIFDFSRKRDLSW